MSLLSYIEKNFTRLILIRRVDPLLGLTKWAATRDEGASYDALIWEDTPILAVANHGGEPPQKLDPFEEKLLFARPTHKVVEFEWYPALAPVESGGWLRSTWKLDG